MRFFWKMLLVALPVGGYWLYKKSSNRSSDAGEQRGKAEENKTSSQSPSGTVKEARVGSDDQIIERLAKINGVTSRVAENLVEKGIYTKENLKKLSRDELLEIKGIGPKRAAKILKLG